MPEKLLTLEEAALILGISEKKLTELVEKGDLPAYRVGGQFLRFRKEQIEAIKDEILTKPASPLPALPKKHPTRHDVAYGQSLGDIIADFFYFNDFYLISGAIILALLWVIFEF